jgi:hypothetical protein
MAGRVVSVASEPCIVICGEEMREVSREPDGEPRWCFRCRAIRGFVYVVIAPVGPSYYDPNAYVKCGTCDLTDGDLFPGRFREWE